jgi:RNA polymerase sigma factor (sigma-70 family)
MPPDDGNFPRDDESTGDLVLAEHALEGDPVAVGRVLAMLRAPEFAAFLRGRGATATEAEDLIGNLIGDCFGGERAKGGLHRLLGRYNGACPLPAFLRRAAVNRLISLKRKQVLRREAEPARDDAGAAVLELPAREASEGDEEIIPLLRETLHAAFAAVDPERMVLFRLVHTHGVPQKRVAAIWGWHESKVSRALEAVRVELKAAILDGIRRRDAWLDLRWEDFVALCSESNDLFGG